MARLKTWLIPLTAVSLCGCSGLSSLLTPTTGAGLTGATGSSGGTGTSSSGAFDPSTLDSALTPTQVTNIKSTVATFIQANSGSNFTMPMGNNFTLPIGNNFTMPMGNNFTLPAGNNLTSSLAAFKILNLSETESKPLAFGYQPIGSGETLTTQQTNQLPANSSDTTDYTATVAGSTINGTLNLTWWKDPANSGAPCSYKDDFHYADASGNPGLKDGSSDLGGDFVVEESAASFSAAPDSAGTLMLGVNALPTEPASTGNDATMYHYKQTADLTDTQNDSVVMGIDSSNFAAMEPGVVKQIVQVPQTVTASGSIGGPNVASLGFDLTASASVADETFGIAGTMTYGPLGTSILEDYTLDLKTGTANLVYTGSNSGLPWRIILNYDYEAALTFGTGNPATLTGELDGGTEPGNGWVKLADISVDSNGNPVLTYVTGIVGYTETWLMP